MEKTQKDQASHRTRNAVGAAVLLLAGGAAAWLYGHKPASETPVAVQASAPAMPAMPATLVTPATPAEVASAAAVAVQSGPAPAASTPVLPGRTNVAALPEGESPTESLRKVQLGLNGGTAEDALKAAKTLQQCATAAKAPEALFAVRDQPDLLSANVKKAIKDMGGEEGVSNEQIAHAQREQRRCQVFDAATLASSDELLQKAYDGKAAGAAMAYLQALQAPDAKGKADPALIAKLQADVRQAAQAGDPDTLTALAMASGDAALGMGITPTQRNGYRNAYVQIQEERMPGMGKTMGKIVDAISQMIPSAPLTATQQREADALTKQVVDAWRRGRKS
ncbi:hypothetical protein ASC95_28985 [Pelomonas sp. Root1217]|uniref:hypothetical protein n=1 Tax=Pelomonas sp. Root1217 TaxID=1736430 RepID=UPI00070F73B7|nr:hypothetical protein [Pelomonas sp. Root1217]KQV55582.1 hypothetical protein ASC95_28985 [Pelomonas sp. Root1217]